MNIILKSINGNECTQIDEYGTEKKKCSSQMKLQFIVFI